VRDRAGLSTIHIPFLASTQSDVQVTADTAASPTTGAHCTVVSWVSDGASGTNVNVVCSADTQFSLAYAVRAPFGLTASATSRGAWAWANNQGAFTLYTPAKNYQYNGFGTGYLTAQKTGTGRYTITIPGNLSYNHSSVLVTAVSDSDGGGGPYCGIANWGTQSASVQCFDPVATTPTPNSISCFKPTNDQCVAPGVWAPSLPFRVNPGPFSSRPQS
jgi:hypothetical protein